MGELADTVAMETNAPRSTYSIWLGCNASIWSHRGYRVVGEHVYTTEGRADAMRIVRESLGDDMVAVRADDGTYCYRTQEDADADDTGAAADAVVSRTEARED